MIFILAPDSFKESMTAKEACMAMERGIARVLPNARCIQVPLADGGEGTMRTLVDLTGGKIYRLSVTGPLGNKVMAEYAILGDGQTAVVELASASGLHLVPLHQRDPRITTTFGTGELIKAALQHGIKKLVIGIGGSATNDGGAGLAQALGIKFLDRQNKEIGFGGVELLKINHIDTSGFIGLPPQLKVEVACDVTNILTGENGASFVYGPQKGAGKEMVKELDRSLEHYAAKIRSILNKEVGNIPGAGAAGGTGAGLVAFLGAKMIRGIDLILNYSGLEEKIKHADYVFTGEGSIDRQVAFGKALSGVIKLAKKHNKPVIAFAGKIADEEALYKMGLTSAFGILPSLCTLEEALQSGSINLERAVGSLARLIKHHTSA